MVLVALANVLRHDVMVRRFHRDPRVKATELLLQERIPRFTPTTTPRVAEEVRVPATVAAVPVRRYRTPHTAVPHAQFLSNGAYVAVVTNGGGGSSSCRGRSVTRARRDATTDPAGQGIYLRDVGSGAGVVGGVSPRRGRARRLPGHVHLRQGHRPPSRRRHHDPARRRRVARGRRRGAPHHAAAPRPRRPGDRRHQLRRDGAGRADRRPGPPGLRQALRRDRVLGRTTPPSSAIAGHATGPTRSGRCTC